MVALRDPMVRLPGITANTIAAEEQKSKLVLRLLVSHVP